MSYVKSKEAWGNRGKINLITAYKLSFKTIAARIILPDKGDSTWAFNNQLFKKIVGVFTAKAINIPKNNQTWVLYSKFNLNKVSKSVLPIVDDVLNIDNNKNNEPHNVYKNK